MRKARKHYAPQENVAILRQHLSEKETVADLCDKHQLQPTVSYGKPLDKLEGREGQIFAAWDRNLEEARRQRQLRRQAAA